MSSIQLTSSQRDAVRARGSAVLVSAAAGSGKTRVLVERLISYVTDPESPRDIDRFLVITYTNAAAAELRSRIAATLADMVAADPGNARLRRQQDLCSRAQIGTIHRFCTGLLRENCHLLGLAPDFRVAEEERAEVLRQSAIEKLLDEAYGTVEKDKDFALLVDTVGAGRDDARLRATVLSLYSRMRSHPAPDRWAARQLEALSTGEVSDAGETVWGKELLRHAGATARYWVKILRMTLRELEAAGEAGQPVRRAYGKSLEETLDALEAFQRAAEGGWDAARAQLPIAFPRVSGVRNPPDPALYEKVKLRRSACKKAAERLAERFNMDSQALLADIRAVRPAMAALLALTRRFDRAYSAGKRRQSLVDFGDLEHLALRLLASGEDSFAPTAVALSLSERFEEVLVDEYQDVNGLQDLLISLISGGGSKLFMVGDVKQSIYRFRLADPGIFIGKYQAAARPESGIQKILLQENFRSRPSVLAAVNRVFEAIMSEELGEIPYDREARLIAGADYPEEGGATVTLTLLEAPEADEEGQTPRADQAEAEYVAGQIRALLDRGTPVWENGASRPLRPGDIAILLRSPGPVGGLYKEALAALGVPVQAEQGGSFFSSLEVSVTLSLLAVIDNPRQDVALISVLRSPVFGFTPDELSLIRAQTPEGDFYAAVRACGEAGDPKCAAFLALLDRLRDFASDGAVSELLRRLYGETDLPALCLAMAGGQVRRSNLSALYRCALRYEAGGGGSLFGFVSFLRRMMERGEEPAAAALAPENCVVITSIHRSKGLEYPVVFLAGTGRRFNKRDLIAPVLLHPHLGLGPMFTDADRGLEYPTLPRQAVSQRLNAEGLSEEMRVLYVAMTRARERLYISGCFKKPDELVEKLSQTLTNPPDPTALAEATCPAHWLITAALLSEDGTIRLERASASGKAPGAESEGAERSCEDPEDTGQTEALAARMRWEYLHPGAAGLPAKLTATELKTPDFAASADPESASLRMRETVFRRPRLGKEDPRPLTGAEAGTALHQLMQSIDLSKVGSAETVAGEIRRLEASGHLSPEQARAVDPASVAAFFRSDTGLRILSAERVHRELRFSLLADAEKFFGPGVRGEEILLQGVVDCCLEAKDELTIIDYKTDYVNKTTLQSRAEGYFGQVLAYAEAMERIFQKPVRACILYFLTAKEAVFVPLDAKNEKI